MFNKRGVDAVVATVLIIMITVAAVAIIWTVVIPMIKNTATTATAEKVSLTIDTAEGYTVYDNSTKLAKVQVTRGAEDSSDYNYIQINFVIDGESVPYILPAPKKGTTFTYDIKSFKGKPDKIEIAPVMNTSQKNISGEIASEISGNIPEVAQSIVLPQGVSPAVPEGYSRTVYFVKPSRTNVEDCISPSVCITRGDRYSIYNSLEEGGFDWNVAPAKTLWAYGSCSDWKTLNFQSFYATVGGGFGNNVPGQHFCLELTEEKEYYDINFESWASGNSCFPRDFSYNRTDNATGQKVVFSYEGNNFSPDCISPSVCIARGTSSALYNSLVENGWTGNPSKTLWAYGNCSSPSLDFQSFDSTIGGGFGNNVFNGPFCMKLTQENKSYTVSFNSWERGIWGGGRGCGGFSYTRTFYGKEGEM